MVDFTFAIDTLVKLLLVALIVSVTWVINFLFGRIVIGVVSKRNRSLAYEASSVASIVIWMAGILLALPVLGASDIVVSVVILLVGAFLILATRDFTGNWFAGQTIKKVVPFRIGDWIRAAGTYGRVAKVDDLYTTIVTPENESVIIPNSKLTSEVIVDRSANEWVKVPLEVDVPAGLELSVATVTVSDLVRELSSVYSGAVQNGQPEIYIVSQSSEKIRFRVLLKLANPAKEDEVKSEFQRKLGTLLLPEKD